MNEICGCKIPRDGLSSRQSPRSDSWAGGATIRTHKVVGIIKQHKTMHKHLVVVFDSHWPRHSHREAVIDLQTTCPGINTLTTKQSTGVDRRRLLEL